MEIKVLHIVLSLGTGGLENGVVNIINRSEANKYLIDVVCLRKLGELSRRITNKNTRIIYEPIKSKSLFGAINLVRQLNKQNNYHIIHTHGWATMLVGYLASFFRMKSIVINGEHGTLYYDSLKKRIIQKFLFNRMTLNLSVSNALIQEISRKFKVKPERFKAILNGVDTDKFKPRQEIRNKLRKELKISDDTFVIGTVGRLVEVKNFPSLIRAFALVKKQLSNAKLILAGEGPENEALVNLSSKLEVLDDVLFLGRRDDIADLLNIYDVFVLPSFREGLSNTILEAMSSGLPAVVTSVGGSPEIVIDGETGYLFEVDDVQHLAEILILLNDNSTLRYSISKNSRQHALANYTLSTMVNNYDDVYSDLATKQQETN